MEDKSDRENAEDDAFIDASLALMTERQRYRLKRRYVDSYRAERAKSAAWTAEHQWLKDNP
jgi:hypothetical protein